MLHLMALGKMWTEQFIFLSIGVETASIDFLGFCGLMSSMPLLCILCSWFAMLIVSVITELFSVSARETIMRDAPTGKHNGRRRHADAQRKYRLNDNFCWCSLFNSNDRRWRIKTNIIRGFAFMDFEAKFAPVLLKRRYYENLIPTFFA